MLSVPKNNKYNKYPYHFHVIDEDIYSGNNSFIRREKYVRVEYRRYEVVESGM